MGSCVASGTTTESIFGASSAEMASDCAMRPDLGGTGRNEGRRLANVLADDEQRLHLIPQAIFLQGLPRGAAIGRRLRIGNGDVLHLAGGKRVLETLQFGVDGHRRSLRHDEAQLPARKDNGLAFRKSTLGKLLDALVVGGEQSLERRGVLDLMHEIAGGAIGDLHALTGFLLVALGDLVERIAQARRRGDRGRIIGAHRRLRSGGKRDDRHRTSASRTAALRALKDKLMTISMPFPAA